MSLFKVKAPSKCSNCSLIGHNISKCNQPCGHCKSTEHKRKVCKNDHVSISVLAERYNIARTRAIEDILYKQNKANEGLYIEFRNSNVPEIVTENIVKFILIYICKRDVLWGKGIGMKLPGDLYEYLTRDTDPNILECKAFTSDGPSSFGPKKIFKKIYFLDMRLWLNTDNQKLVLWEVNLTNDSPAWKGIQMNTEETQEMQSNNGNRPHIGWEKIKEQIEVSSPGVITKLYDGTFDELMKY